MEAMARMRTASGWPPSSMLPKSAIICWHVAMNLGGSTSGPSDDFCSSPKPSASASLSSNARSRIARCVSASSDRSSARSNRFSGASFANRLSISSRQRLARFFMSSAACAPAGPAASACWRFASSNSISGASTWFITESSVILANILAGSPAWSTEPSRAAACSRRFAESALTASMTRPSPCASGRSPASRRDAARFRSEKSQRSKEPSTADARSPPASALSKSARSASYVLSASPLRPASDGPSSAPPAAILAYSSTPDATCAAPRTDAVSTTASAGATPMASASSAALMRSCASACCFSASSTAFSVPWIMSTSDLSAARSSMSSESSAFLVTKAWNASPYCSGVVATSMRGSRLEKMSSPRSTS
mmetsp:Transcript_35156/g.108940  ORF Transcript_35156/g.108940 Transcript_35156/m.108940 type:complete len:368 (+) Transcript_35156:316-1419(+)